MYIREISTSKLFAVFDRRYTQDEFRAACQVVPGSYADFFVLEMHRCLFDHARDIRAEYKKYYAIEYPTISDFLFWKYGIDKETAQQIASKLTKSTFVGYSRDTMRIFDDETVKSVLKEILSALGEFFDENSD
ncbi:MAG: hypothetical protein WC749_09940 [Dehalococcoidia bacterium]